jgi:WD40 repeat protein/class 3 adenylate cyclase
MSGPAILTFLIADVRGYTSFTAEHGDEAAARLAAAFAEIAREAVEAHEGNVIELRGDEALAVFASPRQALRAAVALQLVFVDEVEREPGVPLRVGIGLDAGEAVPVESGYRGAALNLAARLCSHAGAGEVIASESVAHLAGRVDGIRIDDGEDVMLKGLAASTRVRRVLPAGAGPNDLRERLDLAATGSGKRRRSSDLPPELDATAPLAGIRGPQARRLRWWWREARGGAGGMAVISGPAGIGKTRILAEPAALAARDGAAVRYASAAANGALDGLVQDAAALTDPTLLVLDDLDGADGATQRAAAELATLIAQRPVLAVVAASDMAGRAALDLLARAAAGRAISLAPLDRPAVAEVMALYAPGAEAAPVDAILEASGGIPAQIHRLASQWAQGEATRRLGEAASRAAQGRTGLRALESDLADNVVDLQFVRERALLYGASEGWQAIDGTRVSPFKGLASFDVDDADLFFGRERLVAEMIGRLAGAPLLGVVGPSGSGKSSAVRAGLLPAIASGVLPGSDGWIVALMRPGAHPLRSLDRAVWAALSESQRAGLEGADAPLRAVLDRLPDGARLVIAVDQLEELFTQTSDEEERAAFIEALVEAAHDPGSRALVIVALRADFYGRCAVYPALAELLGASHVLVGPMTGDEYRRAISQPAVRAGLRVEPALADALVGEVVGEPGALPLLSSALLELWQRRSGRTITLDAYHQTGGVRGAVARLAEVAYARVAAEDQPLLRAVMLRLAGPGEGDAVVRRRVPLAEFDIAGNEGVARVLKVLTDARLVTTSEGTVEVAHEALLREWPRLQDWLEEDRAGQRLRAHLIDAAKEWDGSGRDVGELYRGARLSTALDWTADHNLELNELERAFLGASRDAGERETDRQRRTNRRLRGLLAGAAVFLAVAVVAGGLAFVQGRRAEEQSQRAQQAATNAEASRLGAQAVVEDELDTSLLLAREAFGITDSIDTRGTLLASLLKGPGAIRVLPGTGNRVLYIAGAADGKTLLTGDNLGHIAIYDADALELLRTVSFGDQAWFDIAPDGKVAVGATFADQQPALAFLDPRDGSFRLQPLAKGADFAGARVPDILPDGSSFATMENREGQEKPVLVRYDMSGHELRADPLPVTSVDFARFSADGRRVVVSSAEGPHEVAVLDAETLALHRTIATKGFAWALAPNGRTLAVGGEDGSVALYDIETGAETVLDGRHTALVQGAGFSPDGAVLVTTGDDRDVIVWDVASHSEREILHGHAGRAFGTAFDGNGSTAFTVGLDGRVIAWDLVGHRRIGRRASFESSPLGNDRLAAVTPDGSLLAVNEGENHVKVVEVATGRTRWETDPWSEAQLQAARSADTVFGESDQDIVTSLAFSPDGTMLAIGGQNVDAVVFDVASGRELRRWHASRLAWVNDLSFAPDGTLLTANDDGRVVTWDAADGSIIRELRINPEATDQPSYAGAPTRVRASPDGTRIAVSYFIAGQSPTRVAAFDLATGKKLFDVEGDLFSNTIGWSPDGSQIATGGWQSGRLALLDAATGTRTLEPAPASAGFVISVDFAWDGRLVVTGGTDGTVRLFDTTTLKQVGANLPATSNEWVYGFVRPGDELVAVQPIGKLWSWDLDPARWAAQACSVADRQLTESEWRAFLPDRPFAPSCGD